MLSPLAGVPSLPLLCIPIMFEQCTPRGVLTLPHLKARHVHGCMLGVRMAYRQLAVLCRDITASNLWLLACSGVHLALAVGLVRAWGTVGLIAADMANMAMRIAYCLRFTQAHFAGVRGHSLRGLFPTCGTLRALLGASCVTLLSSSAILGGTAGPKTAVWGVVLSSGAETLVRSFWTRAAVHAGVGAACLASVLMSIWRCEGGLIADVVALRTNM